MRIRNSMINTITSFVSNAISLIISFISQMFFLKLLNVDFLGINGLFSNILSVLGIFELGIGSAIVFYLYKPIANNDIKKIKSLMQFYKKIYRIIALIIFCIGMILIPFLNIFVGEIKIEVNIYLVYLLFLISTIASYLVVYKRTLLIAYQKNYIISIIHTVYLILLNVIQIITLYFFRNYYIYLGIKILCQLLENFVYTFIVNKKYTYITSKNIQKLDRETQKDIFIGIKALFFHKIGGVIVNGTDNIIISTFLSVRMVGLYSNYYMVINSILVIINNMFSSIIGSVGNLLTTENAEKKYEVFKRVDFLNLWIAIITSMCLYFLITPFIKLWIGEEYLLSHITLIILIINYFLQISKTTFVLFKNAGGIWKQDKFIPLIEAGINIIASIIFLKIFGLIGVFIGTIISGFVLWLYSYPKFVYKLIFDKGYIEYFVDFVKKILTFLGIFSLLIYIDNLIIIPNILKEMILKMLIVLIISNIYMIVIYFRSENLTYYKNLIKKFYQASLEKINE